MKKALLRFGDYLFVMRPLLLIPAWSIYLLGAEAGRRRAEHLTVITEIPGSFYFGFACLTAILVTAYLLNQVFDQDSDRHNRKGHFLTKGIFRTRTVVLMAVVAFIVASFLFRSVSTAQRLPLVLALVLSLAYSLPPLRLVARPVFDILSNAAGYGCIAFVAGYAAFYPTMANAVALSVPYVFLVAATFLHTTILDVGGDKESGKITTTVVIGVRGSAAVACVLAAVGWIPAALISLPEHGDRIAVVVLSVGVILFVVSAGVLMRTGSTRISSAAVQVATALVTVPAALVWTAYWYLVVPVVVLARVYYKVRFGVDYPGSVSTARRES